MAPALDLLDVTVRVDGVPILEEVSWTVRAGERWAVLGANGAGKTTLLRIASLHLHPSAGTVRVLGEELGHTDVRMLRRRIGLVSPTITDLLRPAMTGNDLVTSAIHGALVPWWSDITATDRKAAARSLDRFGVGHHADRPFATLSSGERQRVMLARAIVTGPDLLLLDEPMAGLDLGARESLLGDLAALAADRTTPPIVLVTHHVEEIPAGMTHGLVLKAGRIVAAGPIDHVLTDDVLSTAFEVNLEITRSGGRWRAAGV